MKDHNLEEIYNTLDSINDKISTIEAKIKKVKPKLQQDDIDMISGFKKSSRNDFGIIG